MTERALTTQRHVPMAIVATPTAASCRVDESSPSHVLTVAPLEVGLARQMCETVEADGIRFAHAWGGPMCFWSFGKPVESAESLEPLASWVHSHARQDSTTVLDTLLKRS